MRFLITATSVDYGPEAGDKLLKDYPCLKDYDLQIETVVRPWFTRQIVYIDIDTIDQLMALQKTIIHPLIIDDDILEIYDGYRE